MARHPYTLLDVFTDRPLAGRVPSRSEVIVGPAGLEFEVLDADPRRVKRLRILRRTVASTEVEISEGQPVAPRPESAAAE